MRSAGCFLLSLLSMFMVLNVSAASRFACVAILALYLSALLLIASLTVGDSWRKAFVRKVREMDVAVN